jgi:SAM-dependent methyltransferase
MQDELKRLRGVWNELGADDPLWAILSSPDKRGRRWDAAEFFAKGESEIAQIEAHCAPLARPREHRLAVDFGCGVGRLTRALAARYAQAIGIDISPSMLAQARALNAQVANVRFVENATAQLEFLADGSVDFLYSVLTLHHIPASLQRAYIGEFLRVLAPEGLAVFQIASGYSYDWRGWAYRLLPNRLLAPLRRRVHASNAAADLHPLPEADVDAIVAAAGRKVLQAFNIDSAGAGFRARLLFVD